MTGALSVKGCSCPTNPPKFILKAEGAGNHRQFEVPKTSNRTEHCRDCQIMYTKLPQCHHDISWHVTYLKGTRVFFSTPVADTRLVVPCNGNGFEDGFHTMPCTICVLLLWSSGRIFSPMGIIFWWWWWWWWCWLLSSSLELYGIVKASRSSTLITDERVEVICFLSQGRFQYNDDVRNARFTIKKTRYNDLHKVKIVLHSCQ